MKKHSPNRGLAPRIIIRTLQAAPLVVGMVLLVAVAQTQAAVWNLDTSKTVETHDFTTVTTDPIDLGENGGYAYTAEPFFLLKMSGYASGSEIASVDSFSLNLNLSFPVGTPNFNASLYVWEGSPANPNLATTGVITTGDMRYPNDTSYQVSLIQASFLTPSSPTGTNTFVLDSTGKANLLAYLQSNYTTDNYLTFTMRVDADDPNNGSYSKLYRLNTGSYTITGALETSPVPEPSTFALVLCGIVTLLSVRRRVKA